LIVCGPQLLLEHTRDVLTAFKSAKPPAGAPRTVRVGKGTHNVDKSTNNVDKGTNNVEKSTNNVDKGTNNVGKVTNNVDNGKDNVV
jgi:hypothetical protein